MSYAPLLRSNCTRQNEMSDFKVGTFIDKYVSSRLIYAYIQGDSIEESKDRGQMSSAILARKKYYYSGYPM